MDSGLMERCNLFLMNRDLLAKSFGVSGEAHCLCALVCAMENRCVEVAKIQACLRSIRQCTKRGSPYRDAGVIYHTATVLSLEEEPLHVLQKAKEIYKLLTEAGFRKSAHLALAALIAAKSGVAAAPFVERFASTAEEYKRGRLPASGMQGYCDIAVAVLSGVTNRLDTERCNTGLLRIVKNEHIARSLGRILVLADADVFETVESIARVSEFLTRQKGFGGLLGVGKQDCIRFAAALAAQEIIYQIGDGMVKQVAKFEMDASHAIICTSLSARTYF